MKYREPIVDPGMTSLRLTGLSADTYYRIHLSALTAQGIGEPIFLDMSTVKAESRLIINVMLKPIYYIF